jgi:AcrR family transcriptional regulator
MTTADQSNVATSPLRAAQQDVTRRRILDAVADLLADPQQPPLTFAAVATAAQVGERTVYRQFATKEDLLEAFWAYFNEQLGMLRYPQSIAELLAVMPEVYSGFAQRAPLMRAHLYSQAGRELRQRAVPRRRESFRAMLADRLAGLPAERQLDALAVVQLLFSLRAWDSMVENWDMDGPRAARACGWAIEALLDALRREQQAARRSHPKSDS